MGLDLSKRRDEDPKLGRGKVPKEIKKRIHEDRRAPADPGVENMKARMRRLKKQQGVNTADVLSKGLRQEGGRWEQPSSWTPVGRKMRKEYEEYVRRLDNEAREEAMRQQRRNLKLVKDLMAEIQVSARDATEAMKRFSYVLDYSSVEMFIEDRIVNVPIEVLRDTERREQIAAYLVGEL